MTRVMRHTPCGCAPVALLPVIGPTRRSVNTPNFAKNPKVLVCERSRDYPYMHCGYSHELILCVPAIGQRKRFETCPHYTNCVLGQ